MIPPPQLNRSRVPALVTTTCVPGQHSQNVGQLELAHVCRGRAAFEESANRERDLCGGGDPRGGSRAAAIAFQAVRCRGVDGVDAVLVGIAAEREDSGRESFVDTNLGRRKITSL